MASPHDDILDRLIGESDLRSPLYNWLDLNYDRLVKVSQRRRIRWAPFVRHFEEEGVLDGTGKVPTANRVSVTWRNVCAARERERRGRRRSQAGQGSRETDPITASDEEAGPSSSASPPQRDDTGARPPAGAPSQLAASRAPADPGSVACQAELNASAEVKRAAAADRADVQVSPSAASAPSVAAPATSKAAAKKPLTPAQRKQNADFLASASRQDRGQWREYDRRRREEQEAAYTVALANHLSERLGVRWEVWNERTYVILEGACRPKDGDDGLPRLWIKGEVLNIETVDGNETPLPERFRAQLEAVKAAVAKVCGMVREEKREAGAAVAGGFASPSHGPASKEAAALATREPGRRGEVATTTPTQVAATASPEIELTDEEKAVAFGFVDWQVKRDGRGSLSEWNRRAREERQAAERRLAEPGCENR